MTKERAIEIINIAIPNPVNVEAKEALIDCMRDGVSEMQLLEVFIATGVDVDREEVFNALFFEKFRNFINDFKINLPIAP